MCSPPAWGWSELRCQCRSIRSVLPTRVGMVRRRDDPHPHRAGAPHPRGDGPANPLRSGVGQWCSPPAWGWSARHRPLRSFSTVLPTRVGMVRPESNDTWSEISAPHPRGDGPRRPATHATTMECSPPAWGWSVMLPVGSYRLAVLPTRVGMVRNRRMRSRSPISAPHPRGDGPPPYDNRRRDDRCSPPAWGWSVQCGDAGRNRGVLPTRVGMVRAVMAGGFIAVGAPHPRGDGPVIVRIRSGSPGCSPPAWGWSALATPGV